jgi:trans-aconitate methyltransferase
VTGEELIGLLAPAPAERILDVGCGMGEHAGAMAARGARVTGIDPNGVLLEQARYRHPGVEFVETSLAGYVPGEAFDAVFAHSSLHWIHPPGQAAADLFRLLRPGGRLAASLGGAAPAAAAMVHYYLPRAEEYQRLLERSGFAEVVCREEPGLLVVVARKPG